MHQITRTLAVLLAVAALAAAQEKVAVTAVFPHVGPEAPSPTSFMLDWDEQADLAAAHPGWQEFAARYKGWKALLDPRTGQVKRAYGPGIQVTAPRPSEEEIATAAIELRSELASYLICDPEQQELFSIARAGQLWYVHFVQRVGGVRIENAGLTLRIDKGGRLVMWGGTVHDTAGLQTQTAISGSDAVALATAHLSGLGYLASEPELTGVEQVFWLRDTNVELTPVNTWRVTMMASEPRADWVVYVDALTGGIATYWNDIREIGPPDPATLKALSQLASVSGVLSGTTHEGLLPHLPPASTNYPDIRLFVNGASVVTDLAGGYVYNGGGTTVSVTSSLDGPWITGNASSGISANFSGSTGSGTYNVVFTDSNSTIGERDMVFFTNKTHARLKAMAPTQTLLDNAITGHANVTSGTCNAFYSPGAHSINFYAAGGGCINTGTSASVVSHEYGHGVTIRIYNAASQSVPGHLGEGYGDCIGGAVEDTSIVGNGFFGPGTNVRNMNNTCQYPSSCGTEIHSRGLVIGGCYWHTRVQFANAFGSLGKDQMDAYLFQHFSGTPQDETESLMEMLLLDDNDANLANGTPNLAKFYQGFTTQHGVPFPLQLVSVQHQPLLDTMDQYQPYTVQATVGSITGGFISSVLCYYRVNGGGFTGVPMTAVSAGTYRGSIPNQPSGTSIDYYVRAVDTNASVGTSPAGAPSAYHSFSTSRSSFFFTDDFETASGWTHAQVATQDDWQNIVHGNPAHAYDPATAFSGNLTWGNDLVPASNWNGNYATNVNNYLTSPPISCVGRTGVHLNYRRWLTVEDAAYDQARILVSANNGPYAQVWQNAVGGGSNHHIDTSWVEHDLDISAYADNQTNVRIRFQLTSDGGLEYGGWNIDLFRLSAVPTGSSLILTSSGGTNPNTVWNLHINGEPGDFFIGGVDTTLSGTFYPGLGDLSLDIFAPSFLLLFPGTVIPGSGQATSSFLLPGPTGLTFHIQGIMLPASGSGVIISNVETLLIN